MFFIASISAENGAEGSRAASENAWDFSLVGREINERIEAHAPLLIAGERMSLVCECGDGDCQEFIRLSPQQYHGIRQNLRTFVVAQGHEMPNSDRVLSRNDSWLVVEKLAEPQKYPNRAYSPDEARSASRDQLGQTFPSSRYVP